MAVKWLREFESDSRPQPRAHRCGIQIRLDTGKRFTGISGNADCADIAYIVGYIDADIDDLGRRGCGVFMPHRIEAMEGNAVVLVTCFTRKSGRGTQAGNT